MQPESLGSLTFAAIVDPDRESELEARLLAFNRARAALWAENHDDRVSPSPLHLFVHDPSSELLGGLVVRTHAIRTWLEVLVLWVDEPYRGLGIGRRLMELAEEEARRRGCNFARLASSSYQAPGFYESLGYTAYGRLVNCPPGDTAYYFAKNLT